MIANIPSGTRSAFGPVLAGVDDEETGSASGALTSVQQLGGAFGIAVLGTVFFGLLTGATADRQEQLRVSATPRSAASPWHCSCWRPRSR